MSFLLSLFFPSCKNLAEVGCEGVEVYVLNAKACLAPILSHFAAPLSLGDPEPVGRLVAGSVKSPGIYEGFEGNGLKAIQLIPVPANLPGQ